MPVPAPQIGDTIAGKYRVESILGRGGMGVVVAARHTMTERRVAVKWMEPDLQGDPDALERFVREARAMGRIDHPNVVGVLDVGTEGGVAYLVMDILRGESLRARMTRERRMSPKDALALLLPAMKGVEAAHEAGVVHRDLKPENLFVVRGADGAAGTTKVLDFGISKLAETETKDGAPRLTKTGHVVGTPTYMSPEQVRGTGIDGRSDVWALCTILYEMLSGKTPFRAESYGALLVAIAVEPYTPLDPSVVAPDLARVIHRGLAKEPEDRWQSVGELAEALAPFVEVAAPARALPRAPVAAGESEPERASALPTAAGPRVDTPELAIAPRAARAPAPVTPAATEPVPAPSRRGVMWAVIAVVAVLGAIAVIRGIGNAARNAMLALPTSTPSSGSTSPAPSTSTSIPTSSPTSIPTSIPTSGSTSSPPSPSPAPAPSASSPPHHHHHAAAPSSPASAASPSSPPAASPPTSELAPATTAGSRSGSIRREDF